MSKTRRNFMITIPGIVGAFSFTNKKSAKDKIGKFYHVVYFWLKEPENDKSKTQFLTSLNSFLDEVKEIKSRHVGNPASTRRPVIDSSYTFSLILSFDNKEDQDLYQDHPAHKRFIAESQDLWERVQVYDSIMI